MENKIINLTDIINENQSFEAFAAIHPSEAYKMNRPKFCNYVRTHVCIDSTDDDIAELFGHDKIGKS